jgi:hypothetical protein
MPRNRQREIGLAALVAVIIGIVAWRAGSTSPDPGAVTGVNPSAMGTNVQPRDPHAVLEVDLDALKAERPEPEESDRNPFRFSQKASPPAVAPPMVPVRPPTAAPPVDPLAPPTLPRIPLKFIGLVKGDNPKFGPLAVLSDTRGVYYGREGETIEGRYRILRIGVESIDLAYLDGSGRQTIRFTGQ